MTRVKNALLVCLLAIRTRTGTIALKSLSVSSYWLSEGYFCFPTQASVNCNGDTGDTSSDIHGTLQEPDASSSRVVVDSQSLSRARCRPSSSSLGNQIKSWIGFAAAWSRLERIGMDNI